MTARILIIAGSDSGGGAGIQADIKTVTMLGGHAMTAITAITAQNTLGVDRVFPLPTDLVADQFFAVVNDIGVDAIKIGMLGRAELAEMVWDLLIGMPSNLPIVLDPVMVATSGDALNERGTAAAMHRLLDLATIVTPNLPELAALGGEEAILAHGCALLVKGGHGEGATVTDRLLVSDREVARWDSPRIDTTSDHGTGCTLASAIATFLAEGHPLETAVDRARRFVRLALRDAPGLGRGHGPMGHHAVRLDLGPEPRLNQITVGMTDYAASRDFYATLGLRQIVDSPDHYARFEAPGGATLSIEQGAGSTMFLECDDLDATVARLQAAGLTFDHLPVEQEWLWREARLTDPAGNAICLYQAGENRRFPPWRIP
ncbi:bifunctional hydroxymethylpyrimidine kinase/phosphomethylpyrimidine kinase [Sphingomonas sp. ERG5]|uniref:bifunctional hydroxymethylpyrimidine kinase/phosphomethylpyrimidine kinase n=1 Tax=Sphingomonas sp. ERG5 TaxID=1381597 RepID=UPI00054B08FF|nr:bifunctional hydroxymethylpyrimidine kinase/phosphomethylpyrimidine kinase [Sphingomonas sp. ERG5]